MYRKRNNYKRRPNRRRYARKAKKQSGWGGTAVRALRLAKRLADAVNIEYKEHTNSIVSNPTYNGAVTILNSVPVGTAFNQRIGDSLKMQNLTVRGFVSAGATADNIRMIIFLDKQNQISAGNNLLSRAGTVFAPVSEKQEDNKYITRILHDKFYQVIPTSAKGGYTFEMVIPLNLHTHYAAGTTNIVDNALKVLFISSAVAATAASVYAVFTVSYTDD